METRAVLARAYPAPSLAEAEAALGLVRFRLPKRRSVNWLGGLMRIAAALVVMAGMFGAGLWTAGYRGTGGLTTASRGAMIPALQSTGAESLAAGVASSANGLVDGTRRFHFRMFETQPDGSRRTLRDTTLAAAAGSDFRVTVNGLGNDPFSSGMNPGPAFSADFAAHVLPGGALFLSSFVTRIDPIGRATVDADHYARVAYEQAWFKEQIQVRRGASATFYPDGPPRAGDRKLGFEISLDTSSVAMARFNPAARLRWPRGLSIQLLPRVQGAFVKVEVGDGTTWRTVFDRPKLLLTRMPGSFFLPNTPFPESSVRIELRPAELGSGPLCVYWHRRAGGRRPYGGGTCLNADGTPQVMPMYGSAGRMLRVTLLESFTTAPWER